MTLTIVFSNGYNEINSHKAAEKTFLFFSLYFIQGAKKVSFMSVFWQAVPSMH